jgi:dihydroorotate dehydrogenase electron transfer subunit
MPRDRDSPLVSREPLDGAYSLLTFRHPEIAHAARAGQFAMIKAGTSADLPLRRPFSIMTVNPREETFTLFVKAIGSGTRALAGLGVGDLAQCLGPLGRAFELPPLGTESFLVAGGYGIAPFCLFSEEQPHVRVFYGGRTAADLQLQRPFLERGVPLVLATEDGSLGERGRVTAALEAALDRGAGSEILYACGPDAMLHAVAQIAEKRAQPCQVSLDPWMGCGIGTCLGCVVKTQRASEERPKYRCACTEGPVFESSVVVWPGESRSVARRVEVSA